MRTQTMDRHNKEWDQFISDLERVCKFKGKTPKDITWECEHDHSRCRELLEKFPFVDIDKSIDYFEKNGGYCDCEVVFNV